MWDSRTVHCNHPAIPVSNFVSEPVRLRRLVAYICMTPTASAVNLPSLLEERLEAYQKGITSTHWPHEFWPADNPYSSNTFNCIVLNSIQKHLLLGKQASNNTVL